MKDDTVNPLLALQTGDGFPVVSQRTRKQILFHPFSRRLRLTAHYRPSQYLTTLYWCFPHTLGHWSLTIECEIGSASLFSFYSDWKELSPSPAPPPPPRRVNQRQSADSTQFSGSPPLSSNPKGSDGELPTLNQPTPRLTPPDLHQPTTCPSTSPSTLPDTQQDAGQTRIDFIHLGTCDATRKSTSPRWHSHPLVLRPAFFLMETRFTPNVAVPFSLSPRRHPSPLTSWW